MIFFAKKVSGPKPQVPRKDKWLAIATWAALLGGLRLTMYATGVEAIIGSVAAIGIGFGVFYAALTYTPLKAYRERFVVVMRYWYASKLTKALIFFLVIDVGGLTAIEYGYHIFTLVQLNDPQFLPRGYSPLEVTAYFAAWLDANEYNGGLRWIVWVSLYKDIEIITFVYLIRHGILFKG